MPPENEQPESNPPEEKAPPFRPNYEACAVAGELHLKLRALLDFPFLGDLRAKPRTTQPRGPWNMEYRTQQTGSLTAIAPDRDSRPPHPL